MQTVLIVICSVVMLAALGYWYYKNVRKWAEEMSESLKREMKDWED